MDERIKAALGVVGGALVVWAIVDQLLRPADSRSWHGRLAGVVPYDFRPPTLDRILAAYWNPDNPNLLTGKVVGVGWGINIPVLLGLVRSVQGRR